jgi:hypothetical protein
MQGGEHSNHGTNNTLKCDDNSGKDNLGSSDATLQRLLQFSDTLANRGGVDVVANLQNLTIESTHIYNDEDTHTSFSHSYSDSQSSSSGTSSSHSDPNIENDKTNVEGEADAYTQYSARKSADKRSSAYEYDSSTYTEEYSMTRSRSSSAYETDPIADDDEGSTNSLRISKQYRFDP